MADKKQLFYGVTQDFLEEQERRERLRVQEEKRLEQLRSQEAEIRAKAEEQKRKNDERKRAYFNYINFKNYYYYLLTNICSNDTINSKF